VFAKTELDETLERFVANAVKWVVLAIGVLMCLETFGVNATGLVAMLTALSVAIGLALQGSLSHFASGVMLLIFRPFKVNDDVTVAGTTGKVDSIDLFTTTILTNDNDTVIIPNGQIFGSVICNHTPEDARMVSVTVNIRGDASAPAVRAALTEAGARAISRSEHALKKPGPSAQLQDFAGPQAWQVKVFCQPGHIEEVREVLWLEVRSTVAEREFGPPPSVQMVRQVT
jgi:small conductance mechanosensitive channel